MITIHFYDGNGFLARQPRQSGLQRRTRRTATFMQRFAHKPANSAISRRDICATPDKSSGERGIGAESLTRPELLAIRAIAPIQSAVRSFNPEDKTQTAESATPKRHLRCSPSMNQPAASSSDISGALPPAAVVSTDTVRSVAKRWR